MSEWHPDDLSVGTTAHPRVFGPVTRTDIVRYAGASGDFNPLHHDDDLAAAAGFAGVFSVGMLHAGMLATYLTDWLGLDGLRTFAVRFCEQVWVGDVLTCSGTVVSIEQEPDATCRIGVELSCYRQTGAAAVTGTATLARPGRPAAVVVGDE
jgi:acyl dehydratase